MFTRLAASWELVRCRKAAGMLPFLPSNDNDSGRPRPVIARGRSALVCRWRIDAATGRPECFWELDLAAPVSRDAPVVTAKQHLLDQDLVSEPRCWSAPGMPNRE